MNHVTLWMPTFILLISIDFDELLENGICASYALYREASGVMEVAVFHNQYS
jgi:hypothetical protein